MSLKQVLEFAKDLETVIHGIQALSKEVQAIKEALFEDEEEDLSEEEDEDKQAPSKKSKLPSRSVSNED